MGLRACFDSPFDKSPRRALEEFRRVRGVKKKESVSVKMRKKSYLSYKFESI